MDVRGEDGERGAGRRGVPGLARPGVHQGVEGGALEGELDVGVPPVAEVLDGVGGLRPAGLVRQVVLEAPGDYGVEQPLLVAEQPVDRRGLHPGRGADRAGGHGLLAPGLEQGRGRGEDAVAGVVHG